VQYIGFWLFSCDGFVHKSSYCDDGFVCWLLRGSSAYLC
jgi:hypothetical protein